MNLIWVLTRSFAIWYINRSEGKSRRSPAKDCTFPLSLTLVQPSRCCRLPNTVQISYTVIACLSIHTKKKGTLPLGECPQCSPPESRSNRLDLSTDAHQLRVGLNRSRHRNLDLGGLGLGGLTTITLRLDRSERLGRHELEGGLALEAGLDSLIELGDGTSLERPNDVTTESDGLHGRIELSELLQGESARSGKRDGESGPTDLTLHLSVLGDVDLGVLGVLHNCFVFVVTVCVV